MRAVERTTILAEIKRVAAETSKSPGVEAFAKATGIAKHHWLGVYWAKWSDALAEAGLSSNEFQQKYDSATILRRVADEVRKLGRVPTNPEMKLIRRQDPSFPFYDVLARHFDGKQGVVSALRRFCEEEEGYSDLLVVIPAAESGIDPVPAQQHGHVYLLRSGQHYKIGRTDTLERRIKEITIALPEAVSLEHTISTDDPPGIEAYWHRRFSDRRMNGEWFKLTREDVAAFRRRKFQ